MTTLYLIVGFLGAGKTTFLHAFVQLLAGSQGSRTQSLRIIVNEFGKVSVDGKLLASLDAQLDEITGGSIFCSCRSDQFEKALDTALDSEPEVIVVEASGLSDPTGIRRILSDGWYDDRITYGGCVCLADAVTLPKVYATARVVKKQLSVCDAVLLNKADIATPEQLAAAHGIIATQRPDVPVYETAFGHIPAGWLEALRPGEGMPPGTIHTADINLHKLTVSVSREMGLYDFTKFLEAFAEDTYRIKGFVVLKDGLYLVDCVGSLIQVKPYGKPVETDNAVTVLYGYGLPAKKSVLQAAAWYPDLIVSVE